jgi:hypothetical protein
MVAKFDQLSALSVSEQFGFVAAGAEGALRDVYFRLGVDLVSACWDCSRPYSGEKGDPMFLGASAHFLFIYEASP